MVYLISLLMIRQWPLTIKPFVGSQNILQDNINNASNWFNSNKLVVNPNKSNVILIGPKSKVKEHTYL